MWVFNIYWTFNDGFIIVQDRNNTFIIHVSFVIFGIINIVIHHKIVIEIYVTAKT